MSPKPKLFRSGVITAAVLVSAVLALWAARHLLCPPLTNHFVSQVSEGQLSPRTFKVFTTLYPSGAQPLIDASVEFGNPTIARAAIDQGYTDPHLLVYTSDPSALSINQDTWERHRWGDPQHRLSQALAIQTTHELLTHLQQQHPSVLPEAADDPSFLNTALVHKNTPLIEHLIGSGTVQEPELNVIMLGSPEEYTELSLSLTDTYRGHEIGAWLSMYNQHSLLESRLAVESVDQEHLSNWMIHADVYGSAPAAEVIDKALADNTTGPP